jgi:cytochrome c553
MWRFIIGICLAVVLSATFLFNSQQSKAAEPTTPASDALPSDEKWCYRCHGKTGTAPNPRVPNLAGQKAHYLVNQLEYFQQGSTHGGAENLEDDEAFRVHRSMVFNAKRLRPEEMDAVAKFYASQTCQSQKGTTKPTGQIPYAGKLCAECHGKKGISKDDETPNLAGQNYEYLVNQLSRFQKTAGGVNSAKQRDWRQHPVMGKVTRGLSGDKIKALAAYFAGMSCR